MDRLRRLAALVVVGHHDPLRLIDLLAAAGARRDEEVASLRRRVEVLEARLAELYVDVDAVERPRA